MPGNMTPQQYANQRTKKQIEKERKYNQVVQVGNTVEKYFPDNPYVITAMLGNIDVETGGSFDFKQKQYEGGPGYGLFQFDFHKPNYRKYLKRKGLQDSEDSQVRYVHDSIYGDEQEHLGWGNAKKLRELFASSKDPVEISDMIVKRFLKPKKGKEHIDRRREASRMYTMALTPATN